MACLDLNEAGLTAVEEQFVRLVAKGYSRRQAAIQAHPQRKVNLSAYDKWAARAIRKPVVSGRLKSLLSAAKIEDLYSAGQWVADVLSDVERAIERGNETAVASARRMLGQALGILKDRVIVATEQSMTDAELVATLAGDDKAKAATLHAVIGTASFSTDEVKKVA